MNLQIAAILSLASVAFACVMISGSSDDCNIVESVAWGKREVSYIQNPITIFGEGTEGQVDDDIISQITPDVKIKAYYGTTHGCFKLIQTVPNGDGTDRHTYTDIQKVRYDSENEQGCAGPGKIASACSIVLLILTLGAFFVLIFRIKGHNDAKDSALKVVGVITTILAAVCDVVAIGHFDDACLRDSAGDVTSHLVLYDITSGSIDPSIGIIMGSASVCLLIISAGFQVAGTPAALLREGLVQA